ncbi:integrase core domain-containing protein [Streptomonospora alba]|uniref:integrase core domain-containing protein n=1 Tax=Streptomonospora alba TaxID=183763 RepID=UPI0009FDF2FE
MASVGSRGGSYDNALAEAFNSLFKAELIRNKGPWRGIDDVEIAVAEYIDWFNQRRLHGELGHLPPAEFEALHATSAAPQAPLKTSQPTLHRTRGLTVRHAMQLSRWKPGPRQRLLDRWRFLLYNARPPRGAPGRGPGEAGRGTRLLRPPWLQR